MISPKNAFTNAAANEAPKVSRYEATTRGVATASQKAGQLMVKVLRKAADSGMSTMKLRYSSVNPSARSKPGSTLCRLRRVRERTMAGALRSARSLCPHVRAGLRQGGFFLFLEDLVVDRAVVEVLLLDLGPAAEGLVHGEGVDLGEVLRVLGEQLLGARAQLVLGGDLLGFV